MVYKVPKVGVATPIHCVPWNSWTFTLVAAHALLSVFKPPVGEPLASHLTASIPACIPFSPSNYNGTWSYTAALADDPPKLKWTLGNPCKPSVSNAEEFFEAFDKRTLAFAGDSQVRELVYNLMGHVLGCCWMQGVPEDECNLEAVVDEEACGVIAKFEAYPPVPLVAQLVRNGRRVTVIYAWIGYPREALVEGKDTFLSLFLGGVDERYAGIDALLLGWGHWDLIFTQPKRSDNLGGLEEVLVHTQRVCDAFARASEERPGLLRKVVWKQLTPDEIDATPHPQFRKRMILPDFRRRPGRAWGESGGRRG